MRLNKTKRQVAQALAEASPVELIVYDGLDDALIGIVEGDPPRLAYDVGTIVRQLQSDGMTEEEAQEYYEFNILALYLGPATPILIDQRAFDIVPAQH